MSFSLTRPPVFLLLAFLMLVTSAEGTSLALGWRHSCAVLTGGAIKCWGLYSNLGGGPGFQYSLADVSGISTATSIGLGWYHSCALLTGGTIKCWGWNEDGQLGDGSTMNKTKRATPVDVSGISTASVIGVGSEFSCALLTGGTIKCWGTRFRGQLGDGQNGGGSSTPVDVKGAGSTPVADFTTATSLALGDDHSCALLTGGTIKCWGSNTYGQLGTGTGTWLDAVVNITTATGISLGYASSCALLTGGTIKCWGYNNKGKLGDGTTTDRTTPVDVSGISTATSIALGYHHSCALLTGGTIKCWGYNNKGQLGDGTTTDRTTPVDVSGISTATSIALGYEHSCALLTGGTIKCWGGNSDGQLGDGTTTDSSTPVDVGLYAPPPPPPPPSVSSVATSFSLIISLFAAFALNALFA